MIYGLVALIALCVGFWLGRAGHYRLDYGFSMGRHWMSIGKWMIYQGSRADCILPDGVVHKLAYDLIDKGEHWTKPGGLCDCTKSFCSKCYGSGIEHEL